MIHSTLDTYDLVKSSDNVTRGSPYECCIRRQFRRYPGERIAKKYQRAAIRRAEYRKLKAIVPAVASKRAVSKLTVIEEAIRYIDELHSKLAERLFTPSGTDKSTDVIRQRYHQQFIDAFQCDPFVSRLCSLPVVRHENAGSDAARRDSDVTQPRRKALNELHQFASSLNDARQGRGLPVVGPFTDRSRALHGAL